MNYDKYKEKLIIDDANLDRELAEQASNFLFVAEAAITAESHFDAEKIKHDSLLAEIDETIRLEAERTKTKVTESGIMKELDRNERVITSKQKLIELTRIKRHYKALQEAWNQRSMLLLAMARKQGSELHAIMGGSVKAAA